MESVTFILQVALRLGVFSLYIGFSGVMGVLLRRARLKAGSGISVWALSAAHFVFLFAPASLFIIGFSAWPPLLRALSLLAGLGMVALGARQPDWTPARIWRLSFGLRFFASALGLAAIWGIGAALTGGALQPVLVGAAATAASAVSLLHAPRMN